MVASRLCLLCLKKQNSTRRLFFCTGNRALQTGENLSFFWQVGSLAYSPFSFLLFNIFRLSICSLGLRFTYSVQVTAVNNLLSRLCCWQILEDDCGLIIRLVLGSRRPASGSTWVGCNGRLALGQEWACEDFALDFPTVDCLVQDIKTCNVVGKEGTSHVFYSFGTDTESARLNVRDKLNGKGTIFNMESCPTGLSLEAGSKKFFII